MLTINHNTTPCIQCGGVNVCGGPFCGEACVEAYRKAKDTPAPPTDEQLDEMQARCDSNKDATTYLVAPMIEDNENLIAEVRRLRVKSKQRQIALQLCDRRCDSLHHQGKHRHKSDEQCPVEEIIREALNGGE